MNASTWLAFASLFSLAHVMVQPTVKMGFPTSIKPF